MKDTRSLSKPEFVLNLLQCLAGSFAFSPSRRLLLKYSIGTSQLELLTGATLGYTKHTMELRVRISEKVNFEEF
jgi:hypothetical protein